MATPAAGLRLNQPGDERAFAHAGRTGQPNDMGRYGQGREGIQQRQRLGLTVWTPVFEEVERPRNSLTIKIDQSGNSAVGWLCHKQRRRIRDAEQIGPLLWIVQYAG